MEKPTILTIDDEIDIIDIITDIFSDSYQVLSSTNATEAIKIMEDNNIDLVISDITMPGMNGLEFCNLVKSNTNLSHIPIVLLTGRTDIDTKISGLNLGADVYIEKPFSPSYLEAQVESLMKNRMKLKNYFASQPLIMISSMAHTPTDSAFLISFERLIEEHLTDPYLDVDFLANKLFMSRASLYRKIKALSNLTPYEMIELIKLNKAAKLIQTGAYKINEVAVVAGFSSPAQLSKSFKRKFGKSPHQFLLETGTGFTES
ncbi:MAG: response regulator [Chitinophagaceae bacterium]|nr:response regulator [Chitinophagaceae bacterium]